MKTLRDLMTPNPITIRHDATVREALGLMSEHHIRHLPVVRDGELISMVSDRDLRAVRRVLESIGPHAAELDTQVTLYASESLFGMSPDAPAITAIQVLRDFHVGAVPVWTHELVGIVSAQDLLDYLLEILEAID